MEIYSHYNGKLGLICFAIYFIMLIKGRRTFSGTMSQSKNYWFVFICMALYSVLGFLEWDTYHYHNAYEEMVFTGMEPFYYWLARCLPRSFLIWRFMIWGVACLLMIGSAKLLKLNSIVFCFIAPLLFIIQLSVTRGAIGIALMVFCAILFIKTIEEKKFMLAVVAILGIFASNFLHKSMIIFIVALILAFIIPLNKRTFIISLVLFPFLYTFAVRFFIEFNLFGNLYEDQVTLIKRYQSSSSGSMNLNGIIMTFFEKTIMILLVFDMTKKFLYEKIKTSKAQFFIYKYAYLLVYISFLFLGQEISSWISNRTNHAASFALVLCVTQCFDTFMVKKRRTVLEKIILIGLIILTVWKQFSFIQSNWR